MFDCLLSVQVGSKNLHLIQRDGSHLRSTEFGYLDHKFGIGVVSPSELTLLGKKPDYNLMSRVTTSGQDQDEEEFLVVSEG